MDLGCDSSPEDGTPSNCGTSLAVPYFVSYILIGSFVFLNLVVAIVLGAFDATTTELVAAFEEQDLESILAIGDGKKKGNVTKTGQFGLGFNSVYHITDCPQVCLCRPYRTMQCTGAAQRSATVLHADCPLSDG